MRSYSVAEAKTHLSGILEQVNILGTGANDPNLNRQVIAADQWWRETGGNG